MRLLACENQTAALHIDQQPEGRTLRTTSRRATSVSRRRFLAATAALAAFPSTAWAQSAPNEDDLIFSSAMAISKAIRSGTVSSEEMVKACLNRIEAVNPKINAVVTLAADRALEEAKRADADLAKGKCRGILHGVPMTIKDSFDTAGVISTAGTEGRRTFVPKRDATAVARLRAVGAILLGKTNTPEFTMSYDTRNLMFGPTKNPYDLNKSPGGSSGGAAAIVAAGGTPFDFGSDTGGSIRVPSCFCGIAGIKPTQGRMPLTGHIVGCGCGVSYRLTQIGPMARFVEDLFPLLRVVAGPDGRDPSVVPMRLRDPNLVKINGLRVAFHTDNGIQPASPEVKQTVEATADILSNIGARVEEGCPKELANLNDFWLLADVADGGKWIADLLKRSGTTRWDPHIDWFSESTPLSGEDFSKFLRTWQKFRADMTRYLSGYDVLLCPVNSWASLPSGFDYDERTLPSFTYTSAFNFTGWPVAVVRCGTSRDGIPIGVQVVAHPWREDVCLAVAKHLETELGGWKKPNLG